MRFSPRLIAFLPLGAALLVWGRTPSPSLAQNPVAQLPAPPLQNSNVTLGGPIKTAAPLKTPAKPAPTTTATSTPIATPIKNAIRVGLSTAGSAISIWAPNGALLRDLDRPTRTQAVPLGATLSFISGPEFSQKIGAQTFKGPVSVQINGSVSQGWTRVAIQTLGSDFARATTNGKSARWGRPYRGSFEVFPQRLAEPNHRKGSLSFINVVGLEDYLKGVVPWEMSPGAPSEALKAQAICARTKTIDFIASKRFVQGNFDVCDYDACQGYPGTENEKPTTSQAVEDTRGLALFYNGRPIDAVYSTNSGGVTASARDVWRGGVPYLQSVRDFSTDSPLEGLFRGGMSEGKWAQFVSQPFPSFARPDGVAKTRYEARKYRWTQFVSVDEATKAFTAQGIARVTSIEVDLRTSSGRARRVKVVGVDETAPPNPSAPALERSVVLESDGPIRSMFSKRLGSTTALPSSLFVVTPQTDASGQVTGWNFSGAGWGHGVGMCQRGAQNHALAGWDARRILNWYYRGVEIRQTG